MHYTQPISDFCTTFYNNMVTHGDTSIQQPRHPSNQKVVAFGKPKPKQKTKARIEECLSTTS